MELRAKKKREREKERRSDRWKKLAASRSQDRESIKKRFVYRACTCAHKSRFAYACYTHAIKYRARDVISQLRGNLANNLKQDAKQDEFSSAIGSIIPRSAWKMHVVFVDRSENTFLLTFVANSNLGKKNPASGNRASESKPRKNRSHS